MEKDKISIIIPVYNTERYLERCITSLLDQTYKNLELIFVDDGSTDKSMEILKNAQKKDKRIIVINQKNSGPSAARNKGMRICTGQYIMFCDSDDTVKPNWCETLYKTIKTYPDAWVICGITVLAADEKVLYTNKETEGIYSKKHYFQIFMRGLSGSVYNKIYCARILKKYNIQFDISRIRGEDVLFNIDYFSYVKNIVVIGEELYNYYRYDIYETLTNRYHPDDFQLLKNLYLRRLKIIDPDNINEFRYHYWSLFLKELGNTMNADPSIKLIQKVLINHKILCDSEFQDLLKSYGKKEMDKYSYFALSNKYFCLYWIIQKISFLKRKNMQKEKK